MSLLEQLYNGDVHPFESIAPKSDTYKAMLKEKDAIFESLTKNMDETQKAMLERFNDLFFDIGSEYAKENFLCGVKLGAEFIIGIAYGDNRKTIEEE